MTYRAPVADIAFALKHAAGLKAALAEGLYGDLDEAMVDQVLVEAGRFAGDVIAPLNRVGDKSGTPFKDGAVTTPPGWKEAYTAWAAAGWNGVAGPAECGGQEPAARGERRLHRDVEFRAPWRSASARLLTMAAASASAAAMVSSGPMPNAMEAGIPHLDAGGVHCVRSSWPPNSAGPATPFQPAAAQAE